MTQLSEIADDFKKYYQVFEVRYLVEKKVKQLSETLLKISSRLLRILTKLS